jgi:hypothetical protein
MVLQNPNHEEAFTLYNELPAELQVAIWKFHIKEHPRKLVSSSSSLISILQGPPNADSWVPRF